MIGDLDLPFDNLQFVSLTLTSLVDAFDGSGYSERNGTCQDVGAVNQIIDALLTKSTLQINCGFSSWRVYHCNGQSVVCFNCKFNCISTVTCPGRSTMMSPCASDCKDRTAAASLLSFSFREKVLYPIVLRANTTSFATSIAIQANLSSAGYLFCVARAATSTLLPTAADVFGSSNFALDFSAAHDNTVSVVIDNLLPQTNYSVFCGTADFSRHFMPLQTILARRTFVRTKCCVGLVGLTFPQSIAPFFASTDPSSQSPFVIGLNVPPAAALTVRVGLVPVRCRGQASVPSGNRAVAVPAVFTLDPSAFDFSVSFFVQSSTPGCFLIVANATGYQSFNGTVTVRSSRVSPPAPSLSSAVLSNDGASVLVQFSSETSQGYGRIANYLGTFACSRLFSFASAASCDCYWATSRTLIILPRAASVSLSPGMSIMLRAGMVQAACQSSATVSLAQCNATYPTAAAQNVTLQSPVSADRPRAILIASSRLSSCDSFVLDPTAAIGSAGRSWSSMSWSVTSNYRFSNLTQPIEAFLNSNYASSTAQVVVIPRSLLQPGYVYTVSLILTNFLGQSGIGTASVSMLSSSTVPQVRVYGSSLTSYRWQPVSLFVTADFPSCFSLANASVSYVWTVYDGLQVVSSIQSVSREQRYFLTEAYVFDSGKNYTVKATALARDSQTNATVYGSSAFTFFVGRSGLVASIGGGAAQTLTTGQAVVLDASESYDVDYPTDRSSFVYRWMCAMTSPNRGSSCGDLVLADLASSQRVSGSVLGVGSFNVTVQVTGRFGDSSSFSVVLTVVQAVVPAVSLTSPQRVYNNLGTIVLSGSVGVVNDSSCVASWTSSSFLGDDALSAPFTVTPTSAVLAAGVRIFQLGLNGFALKAGVTYSFTLSARYSSMTTSASATVTVSINGVPTGGSLQVTPTTGSAAVDLFFWLTSSWADSDLPLQYSMATYLQDSSVQGLVKSFDQVPYISAYMAQGLVSMDYAVQCVVTAMDALGGQANASTAVQVNPWVASATSSATLLSKLQASASSDLAIVSTQLITAAATGLTAVSCTVKTSCSALHRYECQAVPNVCGPCLPDYVGYDGNANSACLQQSVALARQAVGESCIRNSDCLTSVCSSRVCVSTAKPCPSSCSGHGTCAYFRQGQAVSAACKASDAACQAICQCSSGYFGLDCSQTAAQSALRSSMLSSLCSSLYSTQGRQDHSSATVLSLASSVLTLLSDYTFASDATLSQCAAALLEPITEQPALVCESSATWTTATQAISALVAKGQSLPSALLGSLVEAIQVVSAQCQQSLAIGQEPQSVSTPFVRTSTAVVDGSLLGKTVSGAVSDFDAANNEAAGSVALAFTDTASAGEGTSVGLSLIEFTNNPFGAVSNSSAMVVKLDVFSTVSRRRLQSQNVTVNVTLQNVDPIAYRFIAPSQLLLRCENRSAEGYWVNGSCPDGRRVDLFCRRMTVGVYNVSCAGFRSQPRCGSLAGASCQLDWYDAQSSRCVCSVVAGAQTTFVSALQQFRTEFDVVFTEIPFEGVARVPFIVSAIFGALFALFFFAVFTYRVDFAELTKRKKSQKKVYLSDYLAEEDNDSLDAFAVTAAPKSEAVPAKRAAVASPRAPPGLREYIFEAVVPAEFRELFMDPRYQQLTWQAQYRAKLFRAFHYSNFFAPALKHRRDFPPGSWLHRVEHGLHLLELVMRVVHVIFVATAGLYYLMNNDRAPCGDFLNGVDCRAQRLYYDVAARCDWVEHSQSCVPHRPHFTAQQVLAFAGLTVLIAVTLSLAFRTLIDVALFTLVHLEGVPSGVVAAVRRYGKALRAVVPVTGSPPAKEPADDARPKLGPSPKRRIFEGIEDADDIQVAELHATQSAQKQSTTETSAARDESDGVAGEANPETPGSPRAEEAPASVPMTASTLALESVASPDPTSTFYATHSPAPADPALLAAMSPASTFDLSPIPLNMTALLEAAELKKPVEATPRTRPGSANTERSRLNGSGRGDDWEPAYDGAEVFFLASRHRERRAARIERCRATMDNLPVNEEAKLLIAAYRGLNEKLPLASSFVIPDYYEQYDLPAWPTRYDALLFETDDLRYFRVADVRNRFLKRRNIAAMYQARQSALEIAQAVTQLRTDKDREELLLRSFLIDLAAPAEHGALRYIVDSHFHSPARQKHPLTLLFGLEQLALFLLLLAAAAALVVQTAVVLYFAVTRSYSIRTDDADLWCLVTGLALVEVFLLICPAYVLLKDFVVDEVLLMRPFARTAHFFAARSRLVLLRTRGIVHGASLVLVQHFNAACRVSRAVPHLAVARLLLSVNDVDLRPPMTELRWFDALPKSLRPASVETRKVLLMRLLLWQQRLKSLLLVVYSVCPVAHRVYFEWCSTVAVVGAVSLLHLIYLRHGGLAIGLALAALFVVVEGNELALLASWLRRQRVSSWLRRRHRSVPSSRYVESDDANDDDADGPDGLGHHGSVVSGVSLHSSFFELENAESKAHDAASLFSAAGTQRALRQPSRASSASPGLFPAHSLLSLQKPQDSWAEKAFDLAPLSLAHSLSEESLSSLLGQRASVAPSGDVDAAYVGGRYQGESQLLRPMGEQGSLLLAQGSFVGLSHTDDERERERDGGRPAAAHRMPTTADFVPRNIAQRYIGKALQSQRPGGAAMRVGEHAMDEDDESFGQFADDDGNDDDGSASVASGPELTAKERQRQRRQLMLGYGLSRSGGSQLAKRPAASKSKSKTLSGLVPGSAVGDDASDADHDDERRPTRSKVRPPKRPQEPAKATASPTVALPRPLPAAAVPKSALADIQQVYTQKLQSLQSLQQERSQRLLRRELRRRALREDRDNQHGPGGMALAERRGLLQDQLRRLVHRQEQRRHFEALLAAQSAAGDARPASESPGAAQSPLRHAFAELRDLCYYATPPAGGDAGPAPPTDPSAAEPETAGGSARGEAAAGAKPLVLFNPHIVAAAAPPPLSQQPPSSSDLLPDGAQLDGPPPLDDAPTDGSAAASRAPSERLLLLPPGQAQPPSADSFTLPSFDDEDTLPVLHILESFLPPASSPDHYRPMRALTADGDETLHVTGGRHMSQQQRQRPAFVRQRQAQVEARQRRLAEQPPPSRAAEQSDEDVAQRAAAIAELLQLNEPPASGAAGPRGVGSASRSFLLRPGQSAPPATSAAQSVSLQLAQAQPIVLPQRRRIVRVPRTQHPMFL